MAKGHINYSTFDPYLPPSIRFILSITTSMQLKERKCLILICRARRNPYNDRQLSTTLWRTTQPLWSFLRSLCKLSATVLCLDEVVQSRMLSGLLLSMVLSLPYSSVEVEKIKSELRAKEIRAMERELREGTLPWFAMMNDPSYSIDYRITHPRVSRSIGFQIDAWASEISSTVLYPYSGHKLLAKGSSETLVHPDIVVPFREISTTTAEFLYSRTGIQGEGPCEMKQRWYPTNATPRTYFAQGLDAYHSSKYLRDIFNRLGDRFRNINRFTRVLPQLVYPDDPENQELYIYDLSAFTSLFHEHRRFLLDLADRVEGVDVVCADSWSGRVSTTLSQLIRDYVSVNVSNPSYVSSILDPSGLIEYTHNVAGFLGVYANLLTCTIPHGFTLACTNDSFSDNWCAGDDAGILASISKKVVLDTSLSRLGELAFDKVFIGSEPGSVALKRSVSYEHGMVLFRNSVVWPVFSLLFGDERFPVDEGKDVRATFCSGLIPFIQSCRSVVLSDDDVHISLRVLRYVYSKLGLPPSGWFPSLLGNFPFHFTIPILDEFMFESDPLERLVDLFYIRSAMCVVREEKRLDKDDLLCQGYSEGNITAWIRWCAKLGYIHFEKVMEECSDHDGYMRVLDSVRRKNLRVFREPVVYRVRVVDAIPNHVRHLCDL